MESLFRHYASNESLYTATVSPVCEKYGLTYMEFTVLMFLANNPQFDTASDIVRYRHLTKSHVSMSIRSLQEKGLLKGEYHEPNRRTIHLTVLEAAEPIVTDGKSAQQNYGSILFSGFTESEYELFVAYMKRIDNNITERLTSTRIRQE